MKTIYLCGNISSDPETYRWRGRATKLLKGYNVIDPVTNRFNKQLLDFHGSDPTVFTITAIKRSQRILITRDFNLVQSSDIILANLKLITPEKPPIGTLFELAWAWYLRKSVIAIIGDNLYSKHPFTASMFSATASDLEEAVQLIKDFFDVIKI